MDIGIPEKYPSRKLGARAPENVPEDVPEGCEISRARGAAELRAAGFKGFHPSALVLRQRKIIVAIWDGDITTGVDARWWTPSESKAFTKLLIPDLQFRGKMAELTGSRMVIPLGLSPFPEPAKEED